MKYIYLTVALSTLSVQAADNAAVANKAATAKVTWSWWNPRTWCGKASTSSFAEATSRGGSGYLRTSPTLFSEGCLHAGGGEIITSSATKAISRISGSARTAAPSIDNKAATASTVATATTSTQPSVHSSNVTLEQYMYDPSSGLQARMVTDVLGQKYLFVPRSGQRCPCGCAVDPKTATTATPFATVTTSTNSSSALAPRTANRNRVEREAADLLSRLGVNPYGQSSQIEKD